MHRDAAPVSQSTALPAGVEAISLLGDSLRTLPLASAVRTLYEQQLAEAKRAYDHTPTNVDSIIWFARRVGYLGRLRESIAIYSRGAVLFPNDPWIHRHRGHRYIGACKTRRMAGVMVVPRSASV